MTDALPFAKPEIDFLILAERAEVMDGKLYMMGGGFDRLNVADFTQPVAFCVAVGVLVPWGSTNEAHSLAIRVEGEDGAKIEPDVQVGINLGRPFDSVRGQTFRAMVVISGRWLLPKAGTYRVVAALQGQGSRQTVFRAMQAA